MDKEMRTFRFDKLVRDKILLAMQAESSVVEWRTLEEHEYVAELMKKLEEELDELEAGIGKDKNCDLSELADVAEVYETAWDRADHDEYYDEFEMAMIELENGIETWEISAEELLAAKAAKVARSGAFAKRTYIKTVSVSDDSPWLKVYLSNPEKYPELKGKLFDL